jgi:hypothetical protein
MDDQIKMIRIQPDPLLLAARIAFLRDAIVEHRKAMAEYRPAVYDSVLWTSLDRDDKLAYEGMKK